MHLTEENKNLVISKISENEALSKKMDFFENNFSESRSFILGIGSDKQLNKIMYYDSYEALLEPEQKNVNKALVIGGVALIIILIVLILMGVTPFWAFVISTVVTAWFVFGSKTMSYSRDSIRIFGENRESIEDLYLHSSKTYENIGFIINAVRGSIVDYAKTQQIVSLDEVKNNGFHFLPDFYISKIMDEETDEGKYEKIEVSNFQSGTNGSSYLYKSKISSRPITSTILDIE